LIYREKDIYALYMATIDPPRKDVRAAAQIYNHEELVGLIRHGVEGCEKVPERALRIVAGAVEWYLMRHPASRRGNVVGGCIYRALEYVPEWATVFPDGISLIGIWKALASAGLECNPTGMHMVGKNLKVGNVDSWGQFEEELVGVMFPCASFSLLNAY